MEVKSEVVKFTGRIGKPANSITYTHVVFRDKEYTIMKIKFNNESINGVIDKEDFIKVKDYSWHYVANRYISHGLQIDDKKKELYLHNMVMGRIEFPGKGAKESIDHINRIGLDNRKENLRLVSQSDQNMNQIKKKRNITLPEDCGLNTDDIPTHIWYVKANGNHGDRFAIEFKTENIVWKTTSSKKIPLKDKLEVAKKQLQEFYKTYPHLNPMDEDRQSIIKELTDSYHAIITIADNVQ
jgi:hypothetical protein